MSKLNASTSGILLHLDDLIKKQESALMKSILQAIE